MSRLGSALDGVENRRGTEKCERKVEVERDNNGVAMETQGRRQVNRTNKSVL